MQLEPGEAAVICTACNGYLYSTEGSAPVLVPCPYECKRDIGSNMIRMKVPAGTQPYGRS